MAEFVLTDAIIHVDGFDFTGYSNKLTIKPSVEEKDSTVFGLGGYRRRKGGLKNVEIAASGFQDTDATPDAAAFGSLGVADRAVSVGANSPAGSVCYLCQVSNFGYESYDAVGELAPYNLDLKGSSRFGMVRGLVAQVRGDVAATGVLGSAVAAGAGGAGKLLYATLHVFSAGTTITVQVQSDDASGFPSATTRATIGPITVAGGTFLVPVDAAAITDDWWRLNVSAITGTFNVAGAIAVQ